MKYTASQIVERAFNLADLANTDFISHTETTEYLRDAWKSVYQWLINKGDKQFVREVALMAGYGIGNAVEFEIPSDLYQILSLKDRNSGRLIPRHAESESIASNTYEVVNDRIRLYGVTATNLLLTYYTVPIDITFPDKKLYPDVISNIISSASNSVLYDNGSIVNLVTGEALGAITFEEDYNYVLGNGHVLQYNDENIIYLDYSGNVISSATVAYPVHVLYDSNFNVCYQTVHDNEYGVITRNGKVLATNPNHYKAIIYMKDVIIYQDSDYHLIISDDTNDVFVSSTTYAGVDAIPINEKQFIVSYNGQYHMLSITEDWELEDYDTDIDSFKPVAKLRYGLLDTNGSDYSITSWEPDTVFNFPNEMYVSLLACDLALRFVMKQNADSSGLNSLYQNMQTQFMNSLSQDSNYTRISNVYRG